VVLLLSLFSPAISAEKTRILFVGGVEMPSGSPGGPFWHLEHDPFFELTPVRAMWLPDHWGYEDNLMYKAVRLYMPRTYEDLIEDYDVISFFYASRDVIPPKYTKWISDAVSKGKGFMFVGHGQWAFDWTITTVADILPLDILNDQYSQDPTTIRITDHDHPITASLPWSSMGEHNCLAGHGYTSPRQSSEVLAELISFLDPPEPFLVWWEAGKGRSIAMMTVYRYEDNPFVEWDFFPDLTSNLHLYAARCRIPGNPEILHQLRNRLGDFHWRSGALVGTLEFLSKLGGNPIQVEQVMSRANERLKEVEELYLDYDFEAGLNLVEEKIADLERAEELAMELKDRTLFWIYTIEWSTLTATSLVTGILLWALMMKRQFYTEVGTTKLAMTGTALLTSNPQVTMDE
jgi:hypothetical protein